MNYLMKSLGAVSPQTFVGLAIFGWMLGALLDRFVRRLPFGKSVLWPLPRHCDRCWQAIPWTRGLPVLGLLFGPRWCPTCRAWPPRQWFILQLLMAILTPALFVLYFHDPGPWVPTYRAFSFSYHEKHRFALFVYHLLLVCFLVVASFIDLRLTIIPDSVTAPGTLVGLILGAFWFVELHYLPVFPQGWRKDELLPVAALSQYFHNNSLANAVVAWINYHWMMNWNRYLGTATGLVGMCAGAGVVWVVRFVCSTVWGREAMGMGDVTLMAMVGAYLGWQTVLVAFFLAPVSAVFVGALGWILAGRKELPYGPHLSIASIFCIFRWKQMWVGVQPFFELGATLLFLFAVCMVGALALVAVLIQWLKGIVFQVQAASQNQ